MPFSAKNQTAQNQRCGIFELTPGPSVALGAPGHMNFAHPINNILKNYAVLVMKRHYNNIPTTIWLNRKEFDVIKVLNSKLCFNGNGLFFISSC